MNDAEREAQEQAIRDATDEELWQHSELDEVKAELERRKIERQKEKYPPNWNEIAEAIKAKHNYCCERCGHKHEPETGYTLTVHHLDGNPQNNEAWNLVALCQRCHLSIQARVNFPEILKQNLFPFFEVAEWFKAHWQGYLESKQKRRRR